MKWSESHSVVFNSLWPRGLYSPWNSPGQNTGAGSLSLLQGIFPAQGSNPGFPHCRWILYQLSHKGSPNQLYFNKNLKMNKKGNYLLTAFTSTHGAPRDQGQTSKGLAAAVRTGADWREAFPPSSGTTSGVERLHFTGRLGSTPTTPRFLLSRTSWFPC